MEQKYYMYITNSPSRFWIDSYTKYITTVEGFCDMLTNGDFFENIMEPYFQEVQVFSLAPPDDQGNIKVLITGVDWCNGIDNLEHGLIPVKLFT